MSVNYESANGIATVTIDRADRMNALDSAVVDGLEASWKRFADSDDRVAILHATGDRAFSVGADIKDPPGELWRGVPSIGVALDKPVIAAVHGGASVAHTSSSRCAIWLSRQKRPYSSTPKRKSVLLAD